jgi:hypothetical protein
MTSSTRILDTQEIEATDACASWFMKEGIRLMHSGNDADTALVYFDRALELRRRLPTEVPMHAYGLAACWLNRAEALTSLGASHHALALRAYDEALALLRPLPLGDDARYYRRLAIAHQNRGLVLAAQSPLALADAIAALIDAIAVLDHAETMDAAERDNLLAVVWMNLANLQASEAALVSDLAARESARRVLALVQAHEHQDAAAALTGLESRHVLCQIVARRLSVQAESETVMEDVHDATDLADEGLALVREWERRGIDRFRNLASDLFRFGARVYAYYQPHFLDEFISEQLDPQQSAHAFVQSREMQGSAREIGLLALADTVEDSRTEPGNSKGSLNFPRMRSALAAGSSQCNSSDHVERP